MLRAAFLFITACWLSACGSGTHSPTGAAPTGAAPLAGKPDVIISFDGANHACIVALYSEPQGSTIPCADLIPFLKDELRLPSGAIYDTRTIANVDAAEVAKTTRTLDAAGYRFIGGL